MLVQVSHVPVRERGQISSLKIVPKFLTPVTLILLPNLNHSLPRSMASKILLASLT